jgi:hypothetical protein
MSIGHPNQPAASEFFQGNLEVVPVWYHTLLDLARTHVNSNAVPLLEEAPRPFVNFREELILQICQEYGLDPVQSGLMRDEEE